MLGIALADDASHAVPLDDLAMLAYRLHAATDFHRRSVTNVKHSWPDLKSSWHSEFMQVSRTRGTPVPGRGASPAHPDSPAQEAAGHPKSSRISLIAAARSAVAVTARPITTYRAPASRACRGVTTRV